MTEPVWCLVANVVEERRYGEESTEIRRGTRLFAPGAKVWVPDGYAGMGYDRVTAVGRTRHASRYASVVVAAEHLTNWRVKMVYSPAVLARLGETPGGGFPHDHDELLRRAARFQDQTDEVRRRRESRARPVSWRRLLSRRPWRSVTRHWPWRGGR